MSSYTQLTLSWDDSDYARGSLQVDQIVEAAREFVIQHNWSEDALSDLRISCAKDSLGEPGFNRVMSFGVIELLTHVSQRIPEVTFYAKGAGEDFWDIWLRVFRNGVELHSRGPFDELEQPIPGELFEEDKVAHTANFEQKSKVAQTKKFSWLSKFRK